jgi:hypothetical protein
MSVADFRTLLPKSVRTDLSKDAKSRPNLLSNNLY